MNRSLSHNGTTYVANDTGPAVGRQMLPRRALLRLRRRGPRWLLIVLAILAVDAVLAVTVWAVVNLILG